MVLRLEHVKPALNIINVYGRLESRTGVEKVSEGWAEILKELKQIESREEAILIIGNLNRAIGGGHEGINGNKLEISYGGKLIRDLISSGDFFLLNNLGITRGGPWTRVCPGTGKGSCLDLAIGSSNLLPHVKGMMINSSRKFAPRQAMMKLGSLAVTYTYHYPILVELEMTGWRRIWRSPKQPGMPESLVDGKNMKN